MRFAGASLAASTCLCLAPPLAAQTVATPGIALPALPLGDALLLLARRSGRNILFTAADVAERHSPAIRARDFDDALRQIARGNGLVIVRLPGGAVRLTRPVAHRTPPPLPTRPPRRLPAPPRPADADILVRGVPLPRGSIPPVGRAAATLLPEDIERLPDRTIAEALGRLPGVLTLTTSLEGAMGRVDRASRATGDFVAMRGLPGSYLGVWIDGVPMPQSLPYSRGAQLGLMTGTPETSLHVHPILDASRAGDGTAGLIDIRHADPFDAAARRARLRLSTGRDETAHRLGQTATILAASASAGFATADDRLAVFASGAAARRPFASVEQTYQSGNLALALSDAAGASPAGMDPADNLRLAALNAQVTRGISREASGHLAIGWRPDPRLTLIARLTGATRAIDQDIYQLSVQGGRGDDYFTRTPVGNGQFLTQSTRADAHYWFQTNPERDALGIAQAEAEWRGAHVRLDARLYHAIGRTDRPNHIEISFWDPVSTRLQGGFAPAYRDGLPVFALAGADRALLANPLAFPIHNQGERESEFSRDRRFGGELSGHVALRANLQFSIGASALRSLRDRSTTHDNLQNVFAPGTALGQTGLVRGAIGPLLPGMYDFSVPVIDDTALLRATQGAAMLAKSVDDLNGNALATREDTLAGYAALTISARSDLDLVLGLRAQQVRLAGSFWLSGNNGVPSAGIAYGLNALHARYTALLPSIAATWDAAAGLTIEAGLWTGQTRPSPYQLSGGGSVTQDSQGLVQVQLPNPSLQPVDSINADVAINWRSPSGMKLRVAGFAKRLRHYLYDAGDTLNGATVAASDASLRIVQPRNGGEASVAGLETALALPLALLRPSLHRWTLGYDGTLLTSAVHLDQPQLRPVERAQYAPTLRSRLWLRYDDGRLSGDLSYRATGAYVQEYGIQVAVMGGSGTLSSSALDTWVHPSTALDLGIAYRLGAMRLRVTVRNALDDIPYRSTIGRHGAAAPQTILGARQFGLDWDIGF